MDVIGSIEVLGLGIFLGLHFAKLVNITYSAIYTIQSYHRSPLPPRYIYIHNLITAISTDHPNPPFTMRAHRPL